ncbi:MAG TPA: FAD-dependent monooxygenase, partial [Chitinophagales bacterium]|nr:FAD-dependent monooxygenase [Chitinophagales bacterium]
YGKFVSKLRQCLQGLPGVSLIEGSANELLENKDTGKVTGIRYFSKNEGRESEIHARLTVICDGGFSKFRDKLNSSPRQVRGYMLGLLLKNAHLPYPRHGHVFLGGATPFLSYPVSSTETRVLIDFPGEQSPKKDGIFRSYLRETVFRQLPQSMRQAYIRALEEDKFKAMPNVMAASKPVRKGGVILLGDSLNMRHPLTGGGMTVALTDVHLIGDLLSGVGNFKKEEELNKAIEEFYRRRHSENASINILADALYDVMSHPELKQVCFDYLKRGGRYVKAPISILSAVSRDKDVLLRKFFSVAIWGAGKKLLPFPTPKRIAQSFRLIGEAVHIISPLLMNENPSGTLKTMIQAGKWIFPQVNSRNLSAS